MKTSKIAEKLHALANEIGYSSSSAVEKQRIYDKQKQTALHSRHELVAYDPRFGDPEYRRYVEREIAQNFAQVMVKGQHFSVDRKDPYYGPGWYGNVRLEATMFCFTPEGLQKLIDEAVEAGRECQY
jgi:hypothetical protein